MSEKRLVGKNGFLRNLEPKKNPTDLFITLVGISAAVYIAVSLIMGKGGFANIFFIRCDDFYMDFFNSVRGKGGIFFCCCRNGFRVLFAEAAQTIEA